MTEPLIPNPTLRQRLDLLAVIKPRVNRLTIWVSALLAIRSVISLVWSAGDGDWLLASLSSATLVLCTVMWFASLQAKRRAPETQRWIEAQINAQTDRPDDAQ